MNGVVYVREQKPQIWQASPDGVHWTPLLEGSTLDALEQARLTFHRQLIAVTSTAWPANYN